MTVFEVVALDISTTKYDTYLFWTNFHLMEDPQQICTWIETSLSNWFITVAVYVFYFCNVCVSQKSVLASTPSLNINGQSLNRVNPNM